MEAVDILRDQTEQLAALFKIADRLMSEIRFDRFEKLIGRFFELPMLHPRRFAGEKILKQHGLIFCPDAARTAEVRHAGFRADTRAGEKDDGAGAPQARRKFLDVHHLPAMRRIIFSVLGLRVWPAARARWVSPAPRAAAEVVCRQL